MISKMTLALVEKLLVAKKIEAEQISPEGLFEITWTATGHKCTVQVVGL